MEWVRPFWLDALHRQCSRWWSDRDAARRGPRSAGYGAALSNRLTRIPVKASRSSRRWKSKVAVLGTATLSFVPDRRSRRQHFSPKKLPALASARENPAALELALWQVRYRLRGLSGENSFRRNFHFERPSEKL